MQTAVHDSQTGAFVTAVEPVTFTWSTSLLGDGEGTATFLVRSPDWKHKQAALHALFTPHARMLVVHDGSTVAFAGKIDDWWYDRDAGTVEVKTVELANEFAWRLLHGVDDYANGTLTVSGKNISGTTRAIINRFLQNGTSTWQYPIDLPADGSGSLSFTWENFRKYRIIDLIDQIRERGYEIYLRPYLSSGSLRFQTHVAAKITIGTSAFRLDAEECPLGAIKYGVGGAQQLTGLLGVGNGTGEDQETKFAQAPGVTGPVRDARRDFPDLTGAALQAATTATLEAERQPVIQWSVGSFQMSKQWPLAHALPGRAWTVESREDPVIPDGKHNIRVIKTSGALGQTLSMEVQSAT